MVELAVATMPSMTKIAPAQWEHVACTHDGSAVFRIDIDDDLSSISCADAGKTNCP